MSEYTGLEDKDRFSSTRVITVEATVSATICISGEPPEESAVGIIERQLEKLLKDTHFKISEVGVVSMEDGQVPQPLPYEEWKKRVMEIWDHGIVGKNDEGMLRAYYNAGLTPKAVSVARATPNKMWEEEIE